MIQNFLADGTAFNMTDMLTEALSTLIAVVLSWAGFAWVWYTRRANWRAKSFMRQVNVGLNEVRDEKLLLRTLLEDNALEVWLNEVAVDMVIAAAHRTTREMPFISLPKDDDMAYIQRAVLNVISERYSEVWLARAMGEPVKTKNFVFGVTCEKYGEMRTQKLRVMLIEEELLKTRFAPGHEAEADALQVLAPSHQDRITTLKTMGRLYASARHEERRMLATMELGIVAKPTA
ncbi:MAG: hypothetical protein AB7K09_06830 [Planctomycetota bacterium]